MNAWHACVVFANASTLTQVAARWCMRIGSRVQLRYRGRTLYMHRQEGELLTVGRHKRPMQMEDLRISVWGRDVSIIEELMTEALAVRQGGAIEGLGVYVLDTDDWPAKWVRAMGKKRRDRESVILQDAMADNMLADAKRFLEEQEWYRARGIPHRRGYLLYGPPGNGKTSFCQVLAGELGLPLCLLTLSDKDLSDTTLAAVLRVTPARALIMMEDVDALFVKREPGKYHRGVSFSGLLNAIDGIASQEGRILIMTTNHRENLDPALIRPGRVDVQIEVTNANKDMATRLFLRFFPQEAELAEEFGRLVPGGELSMAKLQGHLLKYKDSALSAVHEVHELLVTSSTLRLDDKTVWEYLRNVCLERYASLFEAYGYHLQADLEGLEWDTVEQWLEDASLELRYDMHARNLMQRLLADEEDKALIALCAAVDVPTIKEYFVHSFPKEVPRAALEGVRDGLQRTLSTGPFTGPVGGESVAHPVSRVSSRCGDKWQSLLDAFCGALTPDGKSTVSLMQLKMHLDMFRSSATEAVAHAHQLLRPRGRVEVLGAVTTASLLARAGLAERAEDLVAKGHVLARHLQQLTASDFEDDFGFSAYDAHVLETLLDSGALPHGHVLDSVQLLGFARVRHEYLVAHPTATRAEVDRFSRKVTTCSGHGRISKFQAQNFLQNHSIEHTEALNKLLTEIELAGSPRPIPCRAGSGTGTNEGGTNEAGTIGNKDPSSPRPDSPLPEEEDGQGGHEQDSWVRAWLETAGFGRYVEGFAKQHIVTRSDVLLLQAAGVTVGLLEAKFGVESVGHQLRLAQLIQSLE